MRKPFNGPGSTSDASGRASDDSGVASDGPGERSDGFGAASDDAQAAFAAYSQLTQILYMAHAISQERADFLEANFFQFSFEEREHDRALFNTISDPIDLHYLAHIYNWDDGPEVLGWIADSAYCDRGTAAMIFWRSQPDFYTEYNQESEMDLPDGVLPLLQRIMQHWEQGFYQRTQIAYDRSEDSGAEKLYANNPKRKWLIPAYLIEPTPGKPFPLD